MQTHACWPFEHLPIPCVYINLEHTVIQANIAAEKLILPRSSRNLVGFSIHETNFEASFIDDKRTLKGCLQHLQHETIENNGVVVQPTQTEVQSKESTVGLEDHPKRKTRSGTEFGQRLPPKKRVHTTSTEQPPITISSPRSSRWQWQLSLVIATDAICFSLVGTPKSHWKESYLPQDEEFDFLQTLVEPSYANVPEYANILSADKSKSQVNAAGKIKQAWFLEALAKNLPLGMWNEAFTVPLAVSDGVGPTSLKISRGVASFIRGLEDGNTGFRKIHDATTTVLKNPFNNELLGVLVQARDAIEYTEYLQRLDLNSRAEAAVASGSMPAMVRTMLNDGSIDYFSNSWERFTQSTRRELLHKWQDWFHPDDLVELQRVITASMATGQAAEVQVRLRTGNTWRHFEERFAPFRIDGSIVRWYCISTDIEELVLGREAALQSTERLYKVINSMNLVIFEVDETWKIIQAEGALKVITATGEAMSASDYLGRSLYEICSVIRPGGIDELMSELVKVMNGQSGKCIVDYKLGNQYLRTIAITGVDRSVNSKQRLFGITMDITAERDSEIAKIQVSTMRETQRLKSQFLANISHELRTPISGLMGLLELLADTSLDKNQQEYVDTLGSLAQSLLVIVNDVLDLSKAEAGGVTLNEAPFDFVEVLNDICKSNACLMTRKNVSFEYVPPAFADKVIGDFGRIRQILQNLLGNAIKFTDSGSITVNAEFAILKDTVKVSTIISDSGIGIEPEAMTLLFQPFVQADQSTTREYGGTGLGLSIARNLAQLMGGDVILESERGRGTRAIFSCELRRGPPDTLPSQPSTTITSPNLRTRSLPKNEEISLTDLEGVRVLVVEDNKVNQKIVVFHLKKLGVQDIQLAQNGEEAVTYIKEALEHNTARETNGTRHLPDIILMDCQMPVLDGYDATRQLRARYRYDRPIIALTASAIQGDKEKCIAAGMDDHLPKPVTQQQLSKTIKKWLLVRRP